MRWLLITATAALLPSVSHAMARMPPLKTRAYYSPNGACKVIVKPGKVQADQDSPRTTEPKGLELVVPHSAAERLPTGNAWATFYRRRLVDQGYEPVSVFKLLNPVAPVQAFVSDDGKSLLTAGDWLDPAGKHSLVLYSLPRGEAAADHAFETLPDPETGRLWLEGESWVQDSTPSFSWSEGSVERFHLRLFWGQTLTVHLGNGFPDLAWHDPRFKPEGLTESGALALLSEVRSPPARRGLIRVLGERGGPASAKFLEGLIESEDPSVLHPAMSAYLRALRDKATPYLLKVFRKHKQPRMRQAAASALGGAVHSAWWSDPAPPTPPEADLKVIQAFQKALASDPDETVRAALPGMYLTYFFPRLPDTAEFLDSLAEEEKSPKVREELLKFSAQAFKMYPRRAVSEDPGSNPD